jgi:hypothetical protein
VSVSGVGRLFEPVVEDTGDYDVQVVGHVGVVNGRHLIVSASLAARAGNNAANAKHRGIAVFVTPEPNSSRPPEGWETVDVPDNTYLVQTSLDGHVVLILKSTGRGPESANWVIDGAVEIALTAGTIKLARYGMRMGRSLFNIAGKPVGRAPILSGPTIELAKEEVAAQAAAVTARQQRVLAATTRSQNAAKGARPATPPARQPNVANDATRANTNLDNHPIALQPTLIPDSVVESFMGPGPFKELVRSGRYDAAMRARWTNFYSEYQAELTARFGTRTGFQVPIDEWTAIVDRLAAKWALPI